MKAADARVLLTGAGGGIGRAAVRALRGAGAQVLGVGRGATPPGADTPQLWVQADITTAEGRAAIVQGARSWRANVVVHAAGVPAFGAAGTLGAAEVERVLQVNLVAPIQLTQALLPQLAAQPRAQIVFVGSALGAIGLPGFAVYGAGKAGLQRYAEALRRELAETPVRVQTLLPRSTRTAFNDAAASAYTRATGTASDDPERVAAALLRLIESEAAECHLGWPERLFVRLNGLLGARLDGGFGKHRRALAGPPPIKEGTT